MSEYLFEDMFPEPEPIDEEVPYVAWGGRRAVAPAVADLGYAIRKTPNGFGPRQALFDAAYGYVNGFPASAIAYYVLTRSLHWRIFRWAMLREGNGWNDELRIPISYERQESTDD